LSATFVLGFQVSVRRMHIVKLGFELESQLDFLLMVLGVLRKLFFKLHSELFFMLCLFFKSLILFLEIFHL